MSVKCILTNWASNSSAGSLASKAILKTRDDGTLYIENQLATIDEIGELDGYATEKYVDEKIADQIVSNENLLDNWYFANPIDQRQGYIVPPGTPYYDDIDFTNQVGILDVYAKSIYVNESYGIVTVNEIIYYVPQNTMLRGYIGSEYGIDRWRVGAGVPAIILTDTGIEGVGSSTVANSNYLQQIIDQRLPAGTYTFSALITELSGRIRLNLRYASGSIGVTDSSDAGLISLTVTVTEPIYRAHIIANEIGTKATIIAAKLESGNKQTLAHQDESGNWVLNDPPPNKAIELAKCQRYQIVSDAKKGAGIVGVAIAKSDTSVMCFIPLPVTIREKPALTLKNIGLYGTGFNSFSLAAEITKLEDIAVNSNSIRFLGTSSGLTAGACYLIVTKVDGSLLIDANL